MSDLDELKRISDHLENDYVFLRRAWVIWRTLYASDKRVVEQANAASGEVNYFIQEGILLYVLIGIAKMTDPASTGRHHNCTLYSLYNRLPSSAREKIEQHLATVKVAAEAIREHRMKRLAHTDLDWRRGAYEVSAISPHTVTQALASIYDFLSGVAEELCLPCLSEDFWTGASDEAVEFVNVLRIGNEEREIRREIAYAPDDYPSRTELIQKYRPDWLFKMRSRD